MRILDVYLYNYHVGILSDDAGTGLSFTYLEDWLNRSEAIALSNSLQLRTEPFSAEQCRAFFAGVLPDMTVRRKIATQLGVSAKNDFSLLDKIGGECAGAVSFLEPGSMPVESAVSYRTLGVSELEQKIRELPRRPLLIGENRVRLSLAGAQDKMLVMREDGQLALPLDGSPSTHILKPGVEGLAGTVFNEAFCMILSHAIGIRTAEAEIGRVGDIDYLLIKRYDRSQISVKSSSTTSIKRLHQEDFCQALNIMPEQKYQNEGGPTLQQCFELIRQAASTPVLGVLHLLDAVIFNILIGNNDAHGKNFSLIYDWSDDHACSISVAPLYDLISTVCYTGLNDSMAMKLGGEYDSERVFPRHFDLFANEIKISKQSLHRRVVEISSEVLRKAPDVLQTVPQAKPVADIIERRTQRMLERFARSVEN